MVKSMALVYTFEMQSKLIRGHLNLCFASCDGGDEFLKNITIGISLSSYRLESKAKAKREGY